MALNPVFDAPVPILGALGIPWWVIISFGVLFVMGMAVLYWLLRFKTMQPVKGYRDTLKKKAPEDSQIWVLGKTMNLNIEMLKVQDSIVSFYSPTRISKWFHTGRPAVIHVGNVPGLVVSDDYDHTRDIVAEIALCHAADGFNEFFEPVTMTLQAIRDGNEENLPIQMNRVKVDKLRKALSDMGGCDVKPTPITNYHDYEVCGRKILKALFPDGIPVPSYSMYSPARFSKYFPKGCSAGFLGGQLIQEARELKLDQKEPGFWEKVMPLGLLCGVGMVAIIAAWMAPV